MRKKSGVRFHRLSRTNGMRRQSWLNIFSENVRTADFL